MPSPRDLVRPGGARQPGTGSGLPGIPRKQPPPAAVRPAGPWVQPLLFTGTRRDYRRARTDRRKDPVPGNPWLAWALHLAHATAAARGWSTIMLESVSRQLVMLLASYAEGELVRVSDFRNAVQQGEGITRTLEILAQMGILDDDRPAAFDGWLKGQLAGLAPESPTKPGAGPVPPVTARRAPRRCTTRASGPTSPPPAPPCWPGPAATATCARSPATTSAPISPGCTASTATPRCPRSGPCSPGRRATARSSATRPPSCTLGTASARPSCRWPPRRSPAPSARPLPRTPGCSSPWQPSTPPAPARSAPCSSATSTSATAGWPSPGSHGHWTT